MKPRLLTILCTLSLLLFLAMVALWVRSYCVGDRVSWTTHRQLSEPVKVQFTYVGWEKGQAHVVWSHDVYRKPDDLPEPGIHWSQFEPGMNVWSDAARRLSFDYRIIGSPFHDPTLAEPDPMLTEYSTFYLYAQAPCWSLTVLTAILPALAIAVGVRRRWRRGRNTSICRICGYDLRATPDRCPECGTTTATMVQS